MTSPDDRLGRLLLDHEIQQFLYHQADLLDHRQYEAWLSMLVEDIHDWMPMRLGGRRKKVDAARRREIAENVTIDQIPHPLGLALQCKSTDRLMHRRGARHIGPATNGWKNRHASLEKVSAQDTDAENT